MKADGLKRQEMIEEIMAFHGSGKISFGAAIRRLRVEVTGMDQETFAKVCNISVKSLYQLETDKGNPSIKTLGSIMSKFGLKVGIVRQTNRGWQGLSAGDTDRYLDSRSVLLNK